MKFYYPYENPSTALQAIRQLRDPEIALPVDHFWFRRMLLMEERRLLRSEQLDALERRIKTYIITNQLTS